MKKIITSIIFSFAILASPILWANNDGSTMLLKKKSAKHSILSSNNFFNKEGGDDAFKKGKIFVSGGYGFPNLGKAVITALITDGTNIKVTGVGPLHFKAEMALSDGVGFGLSVNYISFGVKWNSTDTASAMIPYDNQISRSSLSILARINFHFGTTDKLDPYFGVGAGYKQATYKYTTNDPNGNNISAPGFSPFGFETTIGVRYFFMPGFGLYTEMGIAKSVIQVGLVGSF
jgi:opacity protein-like surface antigen